MIAAFLAGLGAWPSLILIALWKTGLVAELTAIGSALIVAILGAAWAARMGRGRDADTGLALYLGFALIMSLLANSWSELLLGPYFLFGLFSVLFLSVGVNLWLDLFRRIFNPQEYDASAVNRARTGVRTTWAVAFLLCAASSVRLGPVFEFFIPLGLLIVAAGVALWLGGGPAPARLEAMPDDIEIPPEELSIKVEVGPRATNEPIKKVVVIQGSPRGREGVTERVLIPFVAGLKAEEVKVEVIHLADKAIRPCDGDYQCWVETPGRCKHRDDMGNITPRMAQADMVVLATPVILGSMPGLMKNFLDRLLPLFEPWVVASPTGGSIRPARGGKIFGGRLVLLASGAMPRAEEFEAVVKQVEQLARQAAEPLVGRLLRPAADLLQLGRWLGPELEKSQRALFEAGREAALKGVISTPAEGRVLAPLFKDEAAFRLISNIFWETWQEYISAGRAGIELPDLPRFLAGDVRLGLASLILAADPAQAVGLEAVFQFNLSGAKPGQWYLRVKDGRCSFHEGWSANHDLIFSAPSDLLVALIRGDNSGIDGLAEGYVTIQGERGLAVRMFNYFGWQGSRLEVLKSAKISRLAKDGDKTKGPARPPDTRPLPQPAATPEKSPTPPREQEPRSEPEVTLPEEQPPETVPESDRDPSPKADRGLFATIVSTKKEA